MAFMELHNMEMSDEAKIDSMPWLNPKSDEDRLAEKLATPEYPYGLRICLTQDEFDKLGLDPADAFVGAIFHGHFLARVTCCSMSDNSYGKTCRVEAQIENLSIESEDKEDEENKEEE